MSAPTCKAPEWCGHELVEPAPPPWAIFHRGRYVCSPACRDRAQHPEWCGDEEARAPVGTYVVNDGGLDSPDYCSHACADRAGRPEEPDECDKCRAAPESKRVPGEPLWCNKCDPRKKPEAAEPVRTCKSGLASGVCKGSCHEAAPAQPAPLPPGVCPRHPMHIVRPTDKTYPDGTVIPALPCEECQLEARRLPPGAVWTKDVAAWLRTRSRELENGDWLDEAEILDVIAEEIRRGALEAHARTTVPGAHVCKCKNAPCPACGGKGPEGEWFEGHEVTCVDCGAELVVATIDECHGRSTFELVHDEEEEAHARGEREGK